MTHYKHQPVVIVPAAKVEQFNREMQRHGYGPHFASEPCVGKSAGTSAKATHYVVECPCDEGMAAAIKLVLKGLSGATCIDARRGKSRKAVVLDAAQLKPRAAKAVVKATR